MNLRANRQDDTVDVNLTPLIDVVFLLLIFFMVSTTFDKQAKLKVQLPEASAKPAEMIIDPITLSINAKGTYYINDRQVINTQTKTLKIALSRIIGNKKDVTMVLRADARTPHQFVVKAMDTAAQLGITKLSIATVESN